jgi:hypothetical protein
MGPNYVLDKGFKVNSAATVAFGFAAALDTTDATGASVITSTASTRVLGVYQETLDAAKVATGKATVEVRIMGITRGVTGGAVTIYTPVYVDATGAFVTAGAAGTKQAGIALTGASGTGQVIDVLLTPGAAVSS